MTSRFLVPFLCGAFLASDVSLAQEDPGEIVATAVREKGYDCSKPQSAKPDPEHTSPDEKAWIIRCETGTYRVKFMGDRGAEVEQLD